MPETLTNMQLINEYNSLFDSCIISDKKYDSVNTIVDAIVANKSRYISVANELSMPWYFIGIIHNMEASLNFKTHLHNGDPLTKKTTHVPAGRPAKGNPPFTWEESAIDSLQLQKLDLWKDWSIPGTLYQLELYNGMGYRRKGINSPYLWSFSNQYSKGKFTADGIFDKDAISKQCGAAVIFRRMCERQIIELGTVNRYAQIRQLGETVKYDPKKFADSALQLQQLLNSVGFALRPDGFAGERTSNTYKKVSGKYLTGDARRK